MESRHAREKRLSDESYTILEKQFKNSIIEGNKLEEKLGPITEEENRRAFANTIVSRVKKSELEKFIIEKISTDQIIEELGSKDGFTRLLKSIYHS
jgi:hypothetical protein